MNEEDAIINAVQEAINSIFASSLTTVVGFLALVTMKFSIGFDLGLVLAKGIVFSLLTVVFFMPAMILKFAKLSCGRERTGVPIGICGESILRISAAPGCEAAWKRTGVQYGMTAWH